MLDDAFVEKCRQIVQPAEPSVLSALDMSLTAAVFAKDLR